MLCLWLAVVSVSAMACCASVSTNDVEKKVIAGVPVYGYKQTDGSRKLSGSDVPDWILVLEDTSGDDATVEGFCADSHGGCLGGGHPSEHGVPFISLRASESELEALLQKHAGEVAFIETDVEVSLDPEVEVSASSSASGGSDLPWGLDRIDARTGLDATYTVPGDGGLGVHVYVLDTGIRTTHTDFLGSDGSRRAFPTLEAQGNGLVVCASDDTLCAADGHGHGTHCAGTVGGKTYGVAPGAQLHAVKVLSDQGSGQTSWIVSAVDWVATQGLRPAIVSMSLGGNGQSNVMMVAVDAATNAGVTVVVAAGNDNGDACQNSPAFVPSAITVGATKDDDSRASFSSFGACLDIFAPGVNVLSAGIDGDSDSATMSGTSMACPHVAGAVALLLEKDANLSPADVGALLHQRATPAVVSDSQWSVNLLLYVGDKPDMTTTSTTTQAPDFGGNPWMVWRGACTVDADGCLLSPNFPDAYGNSQSCVILVNDSAVEPIHVHSFRTEFGYDKLKVNNVDYHGTLSPEGVIPTGEISWRADGSIADPGWKLCMGDDVTFTTTSTTTTTNAPNLVKLGSFETPNDETYYASELKAELTFAGSVRSVIFRLSAGSDAHIGLFPRDVSVGSVEASGAFYEFVIGGWANTRSSVRYSRGGSDLRHASTPNILSRDEERLFWVSVDVDTGRVAFGRGPDISEGLIFQYMDNMVLSPLNFAIMTSGSTTGAWTFFRDVSTSSSVTTTTAPPVTTITTTTTTLPSTTPSPTSSAPTTASPTTSSPTTPSPTTVSPTTRSPTTPAPTTASPTTASPTTSSPTSSTPTTASPTTISPKTSSPTTGSPTTMPPSVSPTPASATKAPTVFPTMRDSDFCLQVAPFWGAQYRCSTSTHWCNSWAKDMQRCCSAACGTKELTETDCDVLDSAGSCIYPRPKSAMPTMVPTPLPTDSTTLSPTPVSKTKSPTAAPTPTTPSPTMPDNDYCLQAAPSWGAQYKCSSSTRWCKSWAKDMQRCCSASCGTNELTQTECNSLGSAGTCNYPRPTPPVEGDANTETNSHGMMGTRRLIMV